MRKKEKKQIDKVAAALLLSFCVIALTSVLTVKASLDKINLVNDNNSNDSDFYVQAPEQDVLNPVPTIDSKDNVPKAEENQATGQFSVPLEGRVLNVYSVDSPIFSKTLDQYMIHEGIDIAAPLDTQVKAAAAGTVTKIFNDDRYGLTMEINHGNGFCTIYSNLSTDKLVEIGDVVKEGQAISGVGNTALFETLEEAHLHFEIKKDGALVDPSAYISEYAQ